MAITTALQFGGGKDSLATLHLMRPHWDEILVMWLNTGAAFPETIEQMRDVAAMVPNFLEVRTDVHADIADRGWPVDVLPVANSPWGGAISGHEGIQLRPWIECCARNFWIPMNDAVRAHGITKVIRGQRTSEQYKSPIRSGTTVEGVEYVFPLEDWTEAEVFAYLKKIGVAPPAYYSEVKSSLDCWLCTAFLDVKDAQIGYLATHHPEKHAVVSGKLREMHAAAIEALRPLESVL